MLDFGDQFSTFFYAPFEFIVGVIILGYIVGTTFLVAIGLMVVVVVLGYFLSKMIARFNDDLLATKDERMKITK